MDYKKAWKYLEEWMGRAVQEGIDRGFDVETSPNYGMFHAYKCVQREMNEIEKLTGGNEDGSLRDGNRAD